MAGSLMHSSSHLRLMLGAHHAQRLLHLSSHPMCQTQAWDPMGVPVPTPRLPPTHSPHRGSLSSVRSIHLRLPQPVPSPGKDRAPSSPQTHPLIRGHGQGCLRPLWQLSRLRPDPSNPLHAEPTPNQRAPITLYKLHSRATTTTTTTTCTPIPNAICTHPGKQGATPKPIPKPI